MGGPNDIFLAAGFTDVTQLQNGTVWFKRNGHFRFKTATGLEFDSENGQIIARHTNGQIGIRLGITNGSPEFAFYKNDGTKVYSLGQDGIYYVSEVPESFTLWRFLNLGTNVSTTDLTTFHNTIRANMWQKTSEPNQFELRGNKNAYLYKAGRNPYSESNKQYEGYKNTQSLYDNLTDGWYAVEQLGWMLEDGISPSKKIVQVMRLQGGKEIHSGTTNVETNGYYFNQF